MDMLKMGTFLAELRKEQKLTQAELGEKLGVTNKTISRWETGNYMPPVEMLEELSNLYGLTINELLSGRKLTAEEYKDMAESNIRETLRASTFELKERRAFFKKKWRKDHIATIIACTAAWIVLLVSLRIQQVDAYLCGTVGGMLALLYYMVLNNRMMAYVETRIFGGRWNDYNDGCNNKNDCNGNGSADHNL
ncbi:MAG: helix-turn-helix transcriptional regulator [Candidatus Fimisoma sp.]|nr:helix-turn-helix transcriptional regulator [Candidatus Fimisoma sp.]